MKYLLLIILTISCTSIKSPKIETEEKWIYEGLDRKSAKIGKLKFSFTKREKSLKIFLLLWHQRHMPKEIYILSKQNDLTKIKADSDEERQLIKAIDENLIKTKSIYHGEELNWLKHKVLNRYDGLKNFEINRLGVQKLIDQESDEEKSNIKEETKK